jgi:hypothetical protein
VVAVRPEEGPAPHRPVRRRTSTRPTSRPSGRALRAKQVKARELYSRMMRTLAQTGNGWMTFKDKPPTEVQPDRPLAARERRAPLEPVHRDPRGHQPGRDGGVQPRLDQPRSPSRAPAIDTATTARFDFEKLGRTVVRTRGASARPGHRPQLLPDRRGRRSNASGARSASASWACRTCSSSCACRSTRPRRAPVARISEEIYFNAL